MGAAPMGQGGLGHLPPRAPPPLDQATQEQQEKGEEEREAAQLASQELAELRGELQRAHEGHDLAEQVAISSDLPRASPRTCARRSRSRWCAPPRRSSTTRPRF